MSNRFDNRSKGTFMKDVKFGTAMETYFFNKWLDVARSQGFAVHNYSNNGVDNNGEYIEEGVNTAGADYKVHMTKDNITVANLPLEVKWVPTSGKLTLKKNDLKSYQREKAAILFILNMGGARLKKPHDYDINKHIQRIENASRDIYWGIMMPDKVTKILSMEDRFGPISYMGGKMGIIIEEFEYPSFMNIRRFEVVE